VGKTTRKYCLPFPLCILYQNDVWNFLLLMNMVSDSCTVRIVSELMLSF
jgi:hypothetical protein